MADEQQFIEDGLQRTQIDEFFADELGRAGYGGMDVAKTPMGTQIVLSAEKPGMVIGKGGKNIRKITTELEERFDLEDPQIDVQEVDEPDLNARIVADRLANALERGWYFRKAGHTTIDRIMESGALGAEIVLSGKVTGARSRVEKFNRGYIKHNGEPAEEIVDEGIGTAVMKLGTIGVQVRIIPPDAELPDDFEVYDDVEIEDAIADDADETVEDLLEGEPDEESVDEAEESSEAADAAVDEDVLEEEVVDEEVADEGADTEADDAIVDEEVETPSDDDIEEEFDEETIEEIEASVEEMEEAEEAAEFEDEADADDESESDEADVDEEAESEDEDEADEEAADDEADESDEDEEAESDAEDADEAEADDESDDAEESDEESAADDEEDEEE